MDTQKLAFLDDIEAGFTAPNAKPNGAVKQLRVVGSVMAAGAAFFALTAAPANAAPGDLSAQSLGTQGETCTISDHVRRDHLKRCISGGGQASVSHTFRYETACGPGGQKSRYTFDRHMNSSCAGGDMLPYTTPCQ